MSHDNVETFKRGLEAWNDDDIDLWIEQLHPEVRWSALMEEYRGHAGARQAWESFKGDMQLEVRFEEIRDLGDSVLGLGEIAATGRTSGVDRE